MWNSNKMLNHLGTNFATNFVQDKSRGMRGFSLFCVPNIPDQVASKTFVNPNYVNSKSHNKAPAKVTSKPSELNSSTSFNKSEVYCENREMEEYDAKQLRKSVNTGKNKSKQSKKKQQTKRKLKKKSGKHSNQQMMQDIEDSCRMGSSLQDIDLVCSFTEKEASPSNASYIGICMEPLNETPCISFSFAPTTCRPRLCSMSESEDSFIVFDNETDECSSYEDDSTDDSETEFDTESESSLSSPSLACKRVRFVEEKHLCEIHPMIKWSFAYQDARKGPWEGFARDRERFKKRIDRIGSSISHVLGDEHRKKIYNERFANIENSR